MSATDERFSLEESVNCYLSRLNAAYNKLQRDLHGAKPVLWTEEQVQYEWQKALAGLYKTLPRGFLIYLRSVIRQSLHEVSQQAGVSQFSREQYAFFSKLTTLALDAIENPHFRQTGAKPNPNVRVLFRRALQPLLRSRYRSLVHESTQRETSRQLDVLHSRPFARELAGSLFTDLVMQKVSDEKTAMDAAYDVDNNTDVGMQADELTRRRQAVITAVNEAYPLFLAEIDENARSLYRSRRHGNTVAAVQVTASAYHRFYTHLHASMRAYLQIKHCQLGGEAMADCHTQNSNELTELVANTIRTADRPLLTDIHFDLLDNLSMFPATVCMSLASPEHESYGLFSSLYSRLLSVVVTAQRQKYMEEEASDTRCVKQHLVVSAKTGQAAVHSILDKFRSDFRDLKSRLQQVAERTPGIIRFVEQLIAFLQRLFPRMENKPQQIREARIRHVNSLDHMYERVRTDNAISPEHKYNHLQRMVSENCLSPDSPFVQRRLGRRNDQPQRPQTLFSPSRVRSPSKAQGPQLPPTPSDDAVRRVESTPVRSAGRSRLFSSRTEQVGERTDKPYKPTWSELHIQRLLAVPAA